MKLVVGLGNPGEKYEKTRHNLGFMVVEKFLRDFQSAGQPAWSDNSKLKSEIIVVEWQPKHGEMEKIILAKPKTYMNNSGMAVKLLADYYKINSEDVWIINDELDLPMGTMKIRFGGAAAGHHGVESIMDSLGTDKFWRFRLGIGSSHNHDEMAKHTIDKADDYVLHAFSGQEHAAVKKIVTRGSEAIQMALEKGMESAMNRYNTK